MNKARNISVWTRNGMSICMIEKFISNLNIFPKKTRLVTLPSAGSCDQGVCNCCMHYSCGRIRRRALVSCRVPLLFLLHIISVPCHVFIYTFKKQLVYKLDLYFVVFYLLEKTKSARVQNIRFEISKFCIIIKLN